MNTRELDFAYKVRHALHESAENLPPPTLDRLTAVRKAALSRKKKADSPRHALVASQILAGRAGTFFGDPLSWLARVGLVVPLIVVAVGLTSIYQYERQRRIRETAEIDAAVLSDELPLSAYLDHGFSAYLAKRVE